MMGLCRGIAHQLKQRTPILLNKQLEIFFSLLQTFNDRPRCLT